MYGHLNNAVYYELFDSAINGWLITGAGVDVMALPELGVVAESGCRYFRELEYPRPLDVGVRVERLGRSSITYALGLFDAEADELCRARPLGARLHRPHLPLHGADPPVGPRAPRARRAGQVGERRTGAFPQTGTKPSRSPRYGTVPRLIGGWTQQLVAEGAPRRYHRPPLT